MTDPFVISTGILLISTAGFAAASIARGNKLRLAHVEVSARAEDAKQLNQLLDRRADRIARQEDTIARLSNDKIKLQSLIDSRAADASALRSDLGKANARILQFEDAEAARQAQRVAASKRAAEVNRANAAKRKAQKSGAGVAASKGG